jgi:hypothetical protein
VVDVGDDGHVPEVGTLGGGGRHGRGRVAAGLLAAFRHNGSVPRASLVLLAVFLVAGCGGAKNNNGVGSSADKPKGLVAEVSSAKADEGADGVTASTKVKVGGLPGTKVTLEYGLVDALLGSESETEKVVHRYVTTKKVVEDTQMVHVPKRVINSPLLVHFVLYGPDGRYLASADTPEFGPGS